MHTADDDISSPVSADDSADRWAPPTMSLVLLLVWLLAEVTLPVIPLGASGELGVWLTVFIGVGYLLWLVGFPVWVTLWVFVGSYLWWHDHRDDSRASAAALARCVSAVALTVGIYWHG